jgi:hypothetical protein
LTLIVLQPRGRFDRGYDGRNSSAPQVHHECDDAIFALAEWSAKRLLHSEGNQQIKRHTVSAYGRFAPENETARAVGAAAWGAGVPAMDGRWERVA